MKPEELAAIRERVTDNAEGDVMFGRDEMAALLAEVDRLNATLDRLHATLDRAWDRAATAVEEYQRLAAEVAAVEDIITKLDRRPALESDLVSAAALADKLHAALGGS